MGQRDRQAGIQSHRKRKQADMLGLQDSGRGARKRRADSVTKHKLAGKTQRGRRTRKVTGAQTGLGRSQSKAYTNANHYKDRQVDREVGRQVSMWVRQRQAGRQIVTSACFCSPQEAGAAGLRGTSVCVCVCVCVCVRLPMNTPEEMNILSPSCYVGRWRLRHY